ncbi:hypothetical protein [Marinagarivorans algicola]|uniref:hypothetical protein n=1 Tax=Marinagarivorans algicola TaxID=1513270 RepID=UPI0006B89BBB|nr:hypothetical protein [Marinagarivorans algicola]
MKRLTLPLIFLSSLSFAGIEETFTIKNVGASNNTNTVFIDTVEQATGSSCTNTVHFKLPLDDKLAGKFYSAALMAKASGQKIALTYEPNACISGGILPTVFKIVQ